MASNTLRLVLATGTGILIARTLQPESRGIYAVITTAALIAMTIGQLSLDRSQIALWPDASRRHFLMGNGLLLGLILGVVSASVTFIATALFVPLPAPYLLVIAMLPVPFGIAWTNLQGILLLQSRTRLVNGAGVLTGLVQFLPILVFTVTDSLTVTVVIVCWAISTVAPFLLFLYVLRHSALCGDAALARRQLALSGRYHIGRVALYLHMTADVLLLNALASPSEVGLYTVAVSILSLTQVPTEAVRQVCLPGQTVENDRDAGNTTVRALRFNLMFSAIVIIALIVTSPVLVPLVYGSVYAGSVAPLLALAIGSLALAPLRVVEQYLIRLARPMTMTTIAIAALIVNLALNAVLIPHWGAVGAGLASSASYTAMVAVEITWFIRVSKIRAREMLPQISDLRSVLSGITRMRRVAAGASAKLHDHGEGGRLSV
ncbi:O-antigen/teichoic acid export membrane protein [Streptosporangium album]|uniref:O-antigen/teichoic acid export membrane protein n=2 Tax=Streptosporangium album TaxID=47479 RepID=A0A7W7RPG5_9ACTN|nr:O-antigen/teichoic acid export membrane protein [Streptosporangium album]